MWKKFRGFCRTSEKKTKTKTKKKQLNELLQKLYDLQKRKRYDSEHFI